jgi:sec-independent protein translocase protein TatB
VLNFSPEKLLLVGIIALIVLGPQRLPQAARTLGRFMAQVRHLSESFQHEVHGALHDPVDSMRSVARDFHPASVRQIVRDTISSTFDPASPSSPPAPQSPASPSSDRPGYPAAMPVVPPAPDDPSLN